MIINSYTLKCLTFFFSLILVFRWEADVRAANLAQPKMGDFKVQKYGEIVSIFTTSNTYQMKTFGLRYRQTTLCDAVRKHSNKPNFENTQKV